MWNGIKTVLFPVCFILGLGLMTGGVGLHSPLGVLSVMSGGALFVFSFYIESKIKELP